MFNPADLYIYGADMTLNRWKSIPLWQLGIRAFCLIVVVMIQAGWRKRGLGVRGFCEFASKILKRLCYILFMLVFTPRSRPLWAIYAWFRVIDDIEDGDAPPPSGYTVQEYLQQKQDLLDALPELRGVREALSEDLLLVYVMRKARRHRLDFVSEMRELWTVMLWEYKTRQQDDLRPREECVRHASLQDKAVFAFCVKIFDGDINRLRVLLPKLGDVFTSIEWLSDIERDLSQGVVHICKEDAVSFGLDIARLKSAKTWAALCAVPGFSAWYTHETARVHAQWNITTRALGNNFGGACPSRVARGFLNTWMVKRYRQRLEDLKPAV